MNHPPAASLPADDRTLIDLADAAGLMVDWTSAQGVPQRVAPAVLRRVLAAMQLPADTAAQAADSLARARAEQAGRHAPPLLAADVQGPVALPWLAGGTAHAWRLELASGATAAGLTDTGTAAATLPAIDEPGYHRLSVGDAQLTLAVAPAQCFGVDDALRATGDAADATLGLPWGASVQLYSLRHARGEVAGRHAGVGDFGLLADCAVAAARQGAAALAINPVHAPFLADPARYSPYAPSSRQFLNPLYADPAEVFGAAAVDAAIDTLLIGPALARQDAQPLIDWPAIALLRVKLLRHLFDQRAGLWSAAQQADFEAFRRDGGQPLEDHARFEALHARHAATDPALPWWQWPADERRPDGGGAARLAAEQPDAVTFHVFLQWLAARGLRGAQRAAREAGMAIGLVGDLAVGADPAGSHAWSRQGEILQGLGVGAPPDIYNAQGQSWGLCAFSPIGLHASGYQAFIDLLRATMGPVGGIRIDHALGLGRLWLTPHGAPPADGCYLRYPFETLMRLIRLESWRHRAIVIGENLGTVPPGFNAQLATQGMLGIGVLPFEREDAPAGSATRVRFRPPEAWSAEQIATTTTHDMPPLAGWWAGVDNDARHGLGLLDAAAYQAAQDEREAERRALTLALADAAARSPAVAAALQASTAAPGAERLPTATDTPPPVDAAIACVGRTPAALAMLPLEDLLALAEQINLPGTTDGHPNWRRRLPDAAAALFARPDLLQRVQWLASARAEAAPPPPAPAGAAPPSAAPSATPATP